jgi:hypothetical protein
MRLKMLLDTVKKWWKPELGTVSMWALTMAHVRGKLSTGLISILYHVEQAMWKIRSVALETQSRAKATIALHRINKIKPVEFKWEQGISIGFTAQAVATSATFVPSNSIQFNNGKDIGPILTITGEGDVIWNGKPSEAADILVRSFQMAVEDAKGVTKAAKRRYYALACRNILSRAEEMEFEEFLAFLNREVYNKERRVILDSLKGEDNAT